MQSLDAVTIVSCSVAGYSIKSASSERLQHTVLKFRLVETLLGLGPGIIGVSFGFVENRTDTNCFACLHHAPQDARPAPTTWA